MNLILDTVEDFMKDWKIFDEYGANKKKLQKKQNISILLFFFFVNETYSTAINKDTMHNEKVNKKLRRIVATLKRKFKNKKTKAGKGICATKAMNNFLDKLVNDIHIVQTRYSQVHNNFNKTFTKTC